MIRTTQRWRLVAVAAAAGLTMAACGTTDNTTASSGDSGDGGDGCQPTSIAYLGPLTGDYANLGLKIINGAKTAIDEFNKANPDCEITLKEFDSQGDPEKATPLAVQIINDDDIIGVVGPAFSGESDATGEAFNEAGLVTVSASATNPDLTKNGWVTFHRILGNDATQAPADAKYLEDTAAAKKVFVVDDASEYGKGLADGVRKDLGDLVGGNDTVQQKQTDFSATVTKVKSSGADALFYGGYYPEAGLFYKQLRAAGWDGTFVSGDGSKDAGFVEAAGGAKSAEGAIVTCPCAPADAEFTKKYKEATGDEPGTYSAEGYDAAKIFADGVADGVTTREGMLEFVQNYDRDGITKRIKFTPEGEVENVVIYAYEIKNGDVNTGEPIE